MHEGFLVTILKPLRKVKVEDNSFNGDGARTDAYTKLTSTLRNSCIVRMWKKGDCLRNWRTRKQRKRIKKIKDCSSQSLVLLVYPSMSWRFTITAEIHARSLANFYRQYADRHMNLKFIRRVSEREPAIWQFVIVKNKLMSVFNASLLLLIMNVADPRLLWQCDDEIHDQ